jgi:pSer/pThr/pTyr-binding forkhead associated (FHA) protein
VRIGRAQQINDVVIPDPRVSGTHAEIYAQNGGYAIRDLGSTNGTFVNGRRITVPQPLRDADRIALGETEWLYRQQTGQDRTVMMS